MTSGDESKCFGNVQDTVPLENACMPLQEMKGKWGDKIRTFRLHSPVSSFITTIPEQRKLTFKKRNPQQTIQDTYSKSPVFSTPSSSESRARTSRFEATMEEDGETGGGPSEHGWTQKKQQKRRDEPRVQIFCDPNWTCLGQKNRASRAGFDQTYIMVHGDVVARHVIHSGETKAFWWAESCNRWLGLTSRCTPSSKWTNSTSDEAMDSWTTEMVPPSPCHSFVHMTIYRNIRPEK